MSSLVHRLLTAATLMAFGSVICAMYFGGRIATYLVPTFQTYAIVCGCALVLLAALVLVAPSETDKPRRAGRLWKDGAAALFLVVPLFAALSVSKDEFGAGAVMNRNYVEDIAQLPSAQPPSGAVDALPDDSQTAAASAAVPAAAPAIAQSGSDSPPAMELTKDGAVKAEVIDFLYAAQLADMRETFENKKIEVIGQLMPAKENNRNGDRYDLVRMLMTCCAADVQPIALPIHPAKKPVLPEMTWVKISGTATFPVIGGQRRPLIENATIEKTDPPEDTYLY